jgi:nucleotide-binding universal stress UspA family protein
MVESIVVGTDGSDAAGVAVAHAVALACALGARLQIVSAYEPVPERHLRVDRVQVPSDVQVNMREEVLALLESARVPGIETFARVGDAADAILDVAEEQRADLIVVGHKGMTGATRFLLGSVPNKVSHHAPCSVMIVRAG